MVRKLVIAGTILASLAVAACNTVRGAAADVNSVANCTENTINTGRCK
ncbi:MAG TPA: entericidin EcnA/B family protein [Sphingomicrobium sp.]|nr:entericidin EcnA/B family protein [Sphingomicrobium sp.]